MTENKTTPEGLPIVTSETAEGLEGEVCKNYNEFSKRFTSALKRDNPEIEALLRRRYVQNGGGEYGQGMAEGAAWVYEVLRKQAESNRMSSQ